jgi:hypothetical protein
MKKKFTIFAMALISSSAMSQGGFFKTPPAAAPAPAPVAAPVPTPVAAPVPTPVWPEPLSVREGRHYTEPKPKAKPAPISISQPVSPVVSETKEKSINTNSSRIKSPSAPSAPDPILSSQSQSKSTTEKTDVVVAQKHKPVPQANPSPASPAQQCGGRSFLSEWNCMRKLCVYPGDLVDHKECKAWSSTKNQNQIQD